MEGAMKQIDYAIPVGDEVEDRRYWAREGRSRRKSVRQRTLLSGYILNGEQDSVVEVAVRNLSETGARLTVRSESPISSRLLFCIPTRNFATAAKVVWKTMPDLGLEFIDDGAATSARLIALMASLRR